MIGYLPQHFHIYPQLTGRDYLDYVAAMKGITERSARQKEISRLLEMVNLQGKADKKVRTYSGGMKQRLGIAQALLGSPDILIVDEPTSGLDPQERVRFRNVLTRFSIDRTVLLSTHIVADIESNCRRIAVMNKGRLAMNGSLTELQACGKGQVWEAVMSPDEFALIDPMSVVSTRTVPEGVLCRFIGQAPPVAGAFPADPTLEDGYLSLLRRDRHA